MVQQAAREAVGSNGYSALIAKYAARYRVRDRSGSPENPIRP